MSTKYVKLFENWLLTEANKQESFDPAKPSNWPVMQTTIGDFRKSMKKDGGSEFLQSLFRRATNKDVWDENAGENFNVTFKKQIPRKEYDWSDLYFEYMEKAFKVSKEQIRNNRNDYFEEADQYGNGMFKDTKVDSASMFNFTYGFDKGNSISKVIDSTFEFLKGGREDDVKDLLQKLINVKEAFDKAVKVIIQKGYYTKTNHKTFRKTFGGAIQYWIDTVQKDLKEYFPNNQNNYAITVSDGDQDLFSVYTSGKDDASLNPDDSPIIDFKCSGIKDLTEGKDLKIGSVNVENNELTLGQVLAWFHKFASEGSASPTLLSNSGLKQYPGALATVFAQEEAALLPEFAEVVSIGNQNLKLANSKSQGTIVPAFGLNQVLGTVGFAFNSYEISADGKKSLTEKKLWDALKKATSSIEIVGNTDSVGSKEVNQKLSEQRAEAVYEFLKSTKNFGTLKKTVKVTTKGNGKEKPIRNDKKGKDAEAAALNRRVEFIIDGKAAYDFTTLK